MRRAIDNNNIKITLGELQRDSALTMRSGQGFIRQILGEWDVYFLKFRTN